MPPGSMPKWCGPTRKPVDMAELLVAIVQVFTDIRRDQKAASPKINLKIAELPDNDSRYAVMGLDGRLGQVITKSARQRHLVQSKAGQNQRGHPARAAAMSRSLSKTKVRASRPAISSAYSTASIRDRPGEDEFGQNSGLGLNFSRQIITAPRGADLGGEPHR